MPRDLLALIKPRITTLNVLAAMAGLFLAPGPRTAELVLFALLGIGLLIASANTLNQVLEVDVDARMARTRNRPLPAGRLGRRSALLIGLLLGTGGLVLLGLQTNLLTAGLGALAVILYVGAYTPLKRTTVLSLQVGAIPGAMPPLLGWTAVANEVTVPALALFLVLFFWQLPHFLAIAMFRQADYEAAGLKTLPVVCGPKTTRNRILLYSILQVLVTLALIPLELGGTPYAIGAVCLGALILGLALRGLRTSSPHRWARQVFIASLVYLPLLLGLLFV